MDTRQFTDDEARLNFPGFDTLAHLGVPTAKAADDAEMDEATEREVREGVARLADSLRMLSTGATAGAAFVSALMTMLFAPAVQRNPVERTVDAFLVGVVLAGSEHTDLLRAIRTDPLFTPSLSAYGQLTTAVADAVRLAGFRAEA